MDTAVEALEERSRAGMEFIGKTREALDELDRYIERTAAPLLTTNRRLDLAAVLSDKLDVLHRSNPVIQFIGQSITALNAQEIARCRFLNTVETVRLWEKVHREIVAAHRMALRYMEDWLRYAIAAVRVYLTDEGLTLDHGPFCPLSDVRRLEGEDLAPRRAIESLKVLSSSEDADEMLTAQVVLDNRIACSDHKWWRFWDPYIDWKVALALEAEGRTGEATTFLNRFERESMAFFGVPPEEAQHYWNDCARIVASHDLCHFPDFDRARLAAQNAIGLNMNDMTYWDTLRFVNDEYRKHIAVLEAAAHGAGDRPGDVFYVEWTKARLAAEKAMIDGDLLEAFSRVADLIEDFHAKTPKEVIPYAEWMEKHLLRVDGSGIDLRESVFARAFWDYLKLLPSLARIGFNPSPAFVMLMERKAKLDVEAPQEV
jgi:hypothetical protein